MPIINRFFSPIFFNSYRSFSQTSLRSRFDLSLYLVTERKSVKNDADFYARIQKGVEGGVTCVQLRDENEDLRDTFRNAYRIKEMLESRGVPLIINNRVDVALAVKAHGVHLGQKDFPVEEARYLLGSRAIIGLTVDTLEDIRIAEELDIDYVGLHVLPSVSTKPFSRKIWGIDGLMEARLHSRHRFVAIGGVHLTTLETVYSELNGGEKGDGVAMVGELWRGKNPYEVAKKIRASMIAINSLKRVS